MPRMKPVISLFVAALLTAGFHAYGADAGPAPGKFMKMDEPMPIEMARPGTKKGDVQKAAGRKESAIKGMMDREPAAGAKK